MGKRRFIVVGCLGLLTACGEGPAAEDETTEQASEPIVGGALDAAHPAAVAYLMGGKCTATIIDVSGSQGWALTAAHCISGTPGNLRQGQNHADGQYDVQYPVDARIVHPDYGKAPTFDFAMLHFTGATAGTPVIPAMSPAEDNLQVGQVVTLVGYGQTESGGTTQRRFVDKPIDTLTDLTVVYDQAAGGHCFGDSGGPSVRVVGGQDRVAGVASTVTDANPVCTGFGTSVRVSAVYDTFIMPTINGTAATPQTCSQCFEGVLYHPEAVCFDSLVDCGSSNACLDYEECILDCDEKLGCENACTALHPQGRVLYDALFACVCNTGCSVECGDNGICSVPECGYQARTTTCDSCLRGNCCAEGTACGDDAECSSCFPDCPGTNAASNALMACLGGSCAVFCDVDPVDTGTDTGTGTGTDTGTGSDTWTGTGTDTGTGDGGSDSTSGSDPDEDDGCHVSRVGDSSGRDSEPSRWAFIALLGLTWTLRRRRRVTLL